MSDTEQLRKTIHSAIHRLNLDDADAKAVADPQLSLALQQARNHACLAMFRLGQIVGQTLRIPNGGRDE